MKITILNGSPVERDILNNYIENINNNLIEQGHAVSVLTLREMRINFCSGCFDCWVKSPGKCRMADDSYEVCRQIINSDVTIFASPVVMGMVSALLKKTMDRTIPLLHPYIEFVNNECHHIKRYEKYPMLGLLLDKNGSDDEDVSIITDIFKRFALNFKAELNFFRLTSQSLEETLYAISNL